MWTFLRTYDKSKFKDFHTEFILCCGYLVKKWPEIKRSNKGENNLPVGKDG